MAYEEADGSEEVYRGLRCTSQIGASDGGQRTTLVSLPRSAALLESEESPNPLPFIVQDEAWQYLPTWIRLVVRLLIERRLGASSSFRPYLALLPSSFPSLPFNHLPFIRAALGRCSPLLMSIVDKAQEDLAGMHFFLSATLNLTTVEKTMAASAGRSAEGRGKGQMENDDFGLPMSGPLTVREYLWAVCVVLTRAVPMKDATGRSLELIAPMIDLVNHNSSQYGASGVAYNETSDAFEFFTTSAYQEGDEIFFAYGPKTNDDLLRGFGFVEANNRFDNVFVGTILQPILMQDAALADALDFHPEGIQPATDDDDGQRLGLALSAERSELLREHRSDMLESLFGSSAVVGVQGPSSRMAGALATLFCSDDELQKLVLLKGPESRLWWFDDEQHVTPETAPEKPDPSLLAACVDSPSIGQVLRRAVEASRQALQRLRDEVYEGAKAYEGRDGAEWETDRVVEMVAGAYVREKERILREFSLVLAD
ncbi:unnamed protein product [Vitrella brassicaformis CCMP3155]|uniref:Uncharacterized protein n=3 Tax=Vitrella brassicaformis TaxID=1169539 RepID=A0A0G4FS39_VITBC|nr:unnamed protein product [Vitrella brassicaformis CCMP3155]|eukprot:CEM17500.1 unnamed protein product [Vitrella brassicaformis CCMP3155]